jgi:DNA-binding protein H-NS
MIPIDEQIADEIDAFELHRQIHCRLDPMMAAKIASLQRLKAIDAVQVPDYPTIWAGGGARPHVDKKDYDTLRDLLKRESADAKHYRKKSDMLSDAAFNSEERAEAAEAIVAGCCEVFDCRPSELAEKTRESKEAEAKLAAIKEQKNKEIINLVEAAEPLIKYARMRAAKPIRGTDDTIHSIHVGTEWEAELNQSDLLRLAEVVAALNKEQS